MYSIMITGVSGVGKSTIVAGVSRHFQLLHGDYADFMLKIMGSHNKSDILELSWTDREAVYDKVALLIRQLFSPKDSGHYLLENHLTVIHAGRVQTFPPEIFEMYNLKGLCVLEAEPHMIAERRRADTQRPRSEEALDLIATQQVENWKQATTIANLSRAPLVRIPNSDIAAAMQNVREWIDGLLA